jgi:hypothetical protein
MKDPSSKLSLQMFFLLGSLVEMLFYFIGCVVAYYLLISSFVDGIIDPFFYVIPLLSIPIIPGFNLIIIFLL